MNEFTVTLTHTFTSERLSDVLCSALDSQYGVSYSWISAIQKIEPSSWELDSCEEEGHYRQDYPFNPGGALLITDDDGETYTLDGAAIQKGLTVLAEKYPHHVLDILNETDDANTGDALLQCCLFEDIVYG